MLRVPIDALVAPRGVVVRPMLGVAFSGSCWVDPVAPGVRLAACGPLGYLLGTVGWSYSCHNTCYNDNHPPDRNHRSDGSCHCGDSYLRGDSRHLGDSHHRGGCLRRAGSRPRGSSRPPNRGCHLYIFGGDVASRCLWELV